MAFAVIIGAMLFTQFVLISNLSRWLAGLVIAANLSPIALIILVMVAYFILGTAMDTVSMILLTLPIFLGVCTAMGIDLVWFGVLVIIQMELSNLSPPVGLNLFVVAGMVKDKGIGMSTIFAGVWPFCFTMLVFNALLIAFPQIAMFLVGLMKGY
jgi:TRAP-type C4-dicarboxylate transport system permease large subunit